MVLWGVFVTISSGGNPQPVVPPPHVARETETLGAWILLRAFASGCTALTGIEAVSNGVQAFKEPTVTAARRTLTVIIAILMVLLLSIAYLAHAYHIGATAPGTPTYQSLLSQLIGAVAGRGIFYWISIVSILLVLCLSANTSFADFPRLCRAVAADRCLPFSFTIRGRRLVYSEGIWVLAIVSGILLIAFRGVTDRLIPLFAVGAFLAFTLSQAGMVAHWLKRERRAIGSIIVNGAGATATALTVLVVVTVKFVAGAWIVVLLVPSLVALMFAVRSHYRRIQRGCAVSRELKLEAPREPLVIIPILNWDTIAENALHFALNLSPEIEMLHIESGESTNSLRPDWAARIEQAAHQANIAVPRFTVLKSPFRFVVQPIIDHVLEVEQSHSDRTIAVVLPELVERHWYQYFLHNQRARILTTRLLAQGEHRIVIINVPWYLPRKR